jgi:DNA recombination protein RmuC
MQSTMWVQLVAGFVAGGLLVWAFARSRAKAAEALAEERSRELERARSELAIKEAKTSEISRELEAARLEAATSKTRIEVVEAATAEKIAALTAVEQSLKTSFPSLAAAALNANNEAFITLAKSELSAQQGKAKQDLEAKETAIKNLLQPVQTTLEKLEAGTAAIELKRENAYASMLAEVGNIKRTHELLRSETTQLVSALRDSGTRGAWGALQLKRCLEFAGMTQYCSFDLEKFVRLDSGESQRPDCVLYLPNKRTVIVDAKTPMEAFLEAINPSLGADQRRTQLMRHARQVRLHLDALETKAYWKQFPDSPDFVICFLPKEALFSAALEADPTLIEYGSGKVILSTPTTLIALLKAIAYGWQQVEMARDAEVIKGTAISLYDKVTCLYDAFSTIGKRLTSTAKAWEDARVQMEGRGGVFSLGRKLRRYGVGSADLKDTSELQLEMHPLQADDWRPEQQLSLAAAEEDASAVAEESA